MVTPRPDLMVNIGSPGIPITGGFTTGNLRGRYDDEFHRALRGPMAMKTYTEMGANDGTIGACTTTSMALMRSVPWAVETADDTPRGRQEGEFLEENWEDMKHKPQDILTDAFSMVKYGHVVFEKTFKYRRGKITGDVLHSSKYKDGRIGIADMAIRSQTSLREWTWVGEDVVSMWQRARSGSRDVEIPLAKCVHIKTQNHADNPEGLSFYRPLYRPWYFKKGHEENEGIGAQKDATGMIAATAPFEYFTANPTPDIAHARDVIRQMLSSLYRNEHEHIFFPGKTDREGKPTGFDIFSLASGGNRQFDSDKIISRWDRTIAAVFNMQFIFYGGDSRGSQALSIDTTNMYEKTVSALLTVIQDALNHQMFSEMYDLNGVPEEARARIVHGDIKKQDLKTYADTMAQLINVGLITPDDTLEAYTRDRMQLPIRDQVTDMDGDHGQVVEVIDDDIPQISDGVPGSTEEPPIPSEKTRGFIPSAPMRAAASKALEERARMPAAAQSSDTVAVARARDIADGRTLSLASVRYMAAHFAGGVDKRTPRWRGKGVEWQDWNLRGGDAGKRWVAQVLGPP